MLAPCNCYKRHCKLYLGIRNPSEPFREIEERNYCRAFPDRIPYEISCGKVLHLTVWPGQKNDIVFEKGKFEWED